MPWKILSEVRYFKSLYVPLRTLKGSFSLLNQKRCNSIVYCMNSSHKAYQKMLHDNSDAAKMSICTLRSLSKESSKVEKTAKSLDGAKNLQNQTSLQPKPKPSLSKRVWDEIVHYYHGFRLLFIDIRISFRLLRKILRGTVLSRREHRQLVRTVSDLFRLVPFSVFILIPFMEFLLPVVVKLFPQILPSTFQTHSEKEKKIKAQLKLKIETAKFLQDTLDEMALQTKGSGRSQTAKEFATFFETIRASDQQASNKDIIKFSKLFEDEITLDNLDHPSLVALCRLLELHPFGTDNFLRFQLRMKLRSLKADDQMILKEGVDDLTVPELQAASRERGMRSFGVSESRLRSQLQQWLELSLSEKIPPSLLLLSRALYLPETLSTPEQLKVTLSSLSDTAAAEAKLKLSEIEGNVDNKTKLELIKKEEEAIIKETKELAQEMLDKQKEVEKEDDDFEIDTQFESLANDILADFQKTLDVSKSDLVKKVQKEIEDRQLSKEDFDVLEDALESISDEKTMLLIKKEEIEALKEKMANYKHNIENMKDKVLETGREELKESKAASRLSNKVIGMITKMDNLLKEMSKEGEHLQLQIGDKVKEGFSALKESDDKISTDELVLAIRKLKKISDDTRLQQIADVLEKMDSDHDGFVDVDHVLKVLELLGKENVKVTTAQMDEIIKLMLKEDSLKLEEKIEKHHKQLERNPSQNDKE